MKRLFVGNLAWEATEADLIEFFKDFGGTNAMLPKDNESGRAKGFGFIEVEDDQMDKAIEALNGKELSGRPVTINEARPREDRSQGGFNRGGSNSFNRGGFSRDSRR